MNGYFRVVLTAILFQAHMVSAEPKGQLATEVEDTIKLFTQEDSGMKAWFEKSHAYAVFPYVGKGGFVFAGAGGQGQVFRNSEDGPIHIGNAELSQFTVGPQIGGQVYAEVIFFENPTALKRFTSDEVEFSLQTSAVAASEGASANVRYAHGTAVFTLPRKGLMAEASIGGQRFDFFPIESEP